MSHNWRADLLTLTWGSFCYCLWFSHHIPQRCLGWSCVLCGDGEREKECLKGRLSWWAPLHLQIRAILPWFILGTRIPQGFHLKRDFSSFQFNKHPLITYSFNILFSRYWWSLFFDLGIQTQITCGVCPHHWMCDFGVGVRKGISRLRDHRYLEMRTFANPTVTWAR